MHFHLQDHDAAWAATASPGDRTGAAPSATAAEVLWRQDSERQHGRGGGEGRHGERRRASHSVKVRERESGGELQK